MDLIRNRIPFPFLLISAIVMGALMPSASILPHQRAAQQHKERPTLIFPVLATTTRRQWLEWQLNIIRAVRFFFVALFIYLFARRNKQIKFTIGIIRDPLAIENQLSQQLVWAKVHRHRTLANLWDERKDAFSQHEPFKWVQKCRIDLNFLASFRVLLVCAEHFIFIFLQYGSIATGTLEQR